MNLKLMIAMMFLLGCGSNPQALLNQIPNQNPTNSASDDSNETPDPAPVRTYECQSINGNWEEANGGCHLKTPLSYNFANVPVGGTLTFTLIALTAGVNNPAINQDCYDLVHRGYSDWRPFSNFDNIIQYPEGLSMIEQFPTMNRLFVMQESYPGHVGFGYFTWTAVLGYRFEAGSPIISNPEYQICARSDP